MKFSIFSQTFFTVILISTLIPLSSLWLISQHQISESVEGEVEQRLLSASDKLKITVDTWTDTNLKLLNQNADLSDVISMNTEQQIPVMKTIADNYDWIAIAFATDLDGFKTARNDAEEQPILNADGSKAHFRGDRQYFKQVIEGELYGQQVLLSRTTGKPRFCLSTGVENGSQLVGVLTTCSKLSTLSETVTDTRIGDTGFAILVDDLGQVIAHGRPELVAEGLQNISDHPALQAGILGEKIEFEYKGRPRVAYVQEAGLGWQLVVQQDVAEAYAPIARARRNAIILLVVVIAFSTVLAYGLARRFLVLPIQALTRAAEDISRGQLDVQIRGTARHDEIGALARSVKRLAASVRVAFEELSHQSK